jgi:predicted SAM-dependent methyltransferase
MLNLKKRTENLTITIKNLVKPPVRPATLKTPPEVAPAEETPLVWNLEFTAAQLREFMAKIYLKGDGIEIGALHQPLPVSSAAHTKYIDRLSVADLRKQYPELAEWNVVDPDIIDNGEILEKVEDNSQDFVISSHLIEHCEDPIMAFTNWMRVLKPGGVMFLAIPDKRFTFDVDRELTSMEHLLRDHREGPAWSKRQHFTEWVTQVNHQNENVEQHVDGLLEMNYSIHYHVWTQMEMFELLAALKRDFKLDFDIIACFQNQIEVLFILKKNQ